jgi:hypothetical protein
VSVLVDTSVWVDHWRRRNAHLGALLEADDVVVHPMVMGELALGAVHPRAQVLEDLELLPAAAVAEHEEVMGLVERRRLAGRGIGWVDAHLLASALLDRLRLWTLDTRLAAVAERAGVAYRAR